MRDPTKYCQCGRRLHYAIPALETLVEGLCHAYGDQVSVLYKGRAYLVQRHYLALHGVKAWELEKLSADGLAERVR
jgi:hypothetical protein